MSDMEREYKMIRSHFIESAYHPTSDQDRTDGAEEFDAFMNKRLAEAWDQAVNEARARLMMMSMDEDELKAANPYR